MQKEIALALSGLFACTNYGQPMPELDTMVRVIKNRVTSPRQSMECFCQQYIESDEHEEMFAEEAMGWYKELIGMDLEAARATWPEHIKMYEDALAQTQK